MPTDLPVTLYHEPEVFQRERAAMFCRHWHVLGRSDQLAEPGRYVCANIGGYPLFALVDDEGALGGFHNICLHQRLPILDNGAGQCSQLRCRYHGWTYGRDGVLVYAPPAVAPADFGQATYALARVPVARWHDRLVLIHPGTEAIPVDQALAGINGAALGRLASAGSETWTINGNWKLVADAVIAGSGAEGAEACEGGFVAEASGRKLFWAWPSFGIELGQDRAAVWQVVPRTFRRTELTLHLFSGDRAQDASFVQRGERAKTTAEAAQSAFDEGKGDLPHAGHPALSLFHAGILDALGMRAAA